MTYPQFFLLIPALAACAFAQNATAPASGTAAPKVAPDTVVAIADGKPITAGEIESMVDAMGPQIKQFYQKDAREFVRQYALQSKLASIAIDEKLDQESPYKERVRYSREAVLMQSLMERKMNDTPISEEEIQARYAKSGGGDSQYLTKVLYVAFGADGRTEAEAKTKADDLQKQAAGGADFVALVKEHSEEATSREKNGDYPPMRQTDPLPEPVKTAVFALQPGGVTEPIRQSNGFYIFKLEKIDSKPLDQVRDQLLTQIRQERFSTWFQGVRSSMDVKFENEEFFTRPGQTPPKTTP